MSRAVVTLTDPYHVVEVVWDARDQRRAELGAAKAFGFPAGTKFQTIGEALPQNMLSFILFHAAVRDGAFDGTFGEWTARYLDADLLDPENPATWPDPTPLATSPDSSSS